MRFYLFFLILLSGSSFAQNLFLKQFGLHDGIASESVYCAFQDQEGYLWFGTDMGASRFDGYQFENYNSKQGLTGDEVLRIFQDSKGRIWFLPINGKVCFFLNETFYNANNSDVLADIEAGSLISGIAEDSLDGTIYISTLKDGIFCISRNNEVSHIAASMAVYGVWIQDGVRYCIGAEGIYTYDKTGIVNVLERDLLSYYPRVSQSNGRIIIGYGSEILEYKNDSLFQWLQLSSEEEVTWLSTGQENELIIGTRNGAYFVSSAGSLDKASLSHKSKIVTGSHLDNEGNIWFTTLGSGVSVCNNTKIRLIEAPDSEADDPATCLLKQNDIVWIGFSKGKFQKLVEDEVVETYQTRQNQPVKRIRPIDSNTVVVCTKSNASFLSSSSVKHFNHLSNDILIKDSMVYLASNKLYRLPLEVFFGLCESDLKLNSSLSKQIDQYSILDAHINVLCDAGERGVFAGGRTGLYHVAQDGIHSFGSQEEMLLSTINCLAYQSDKNLLFVGTNNEGLVAIRDSVLFEWKDPDVAIKSNNIRTLELVGENQLWIGTSVGVYHSNIASEMPSVVNFGALQGISGIEANDINVLEDTILIAIDNGYLVAPIQLGKPQSNAPEVKLTYFKVNTKEFNIPPSNDIIQLDFDQNLIEIGFLAMSFRNPEGVVYSYKLQGHNDFWNTTTDRYLKFEALPPGNYELLIRTENAQNNVGDIKRIAFQIAKPYWQKSWFYVLTSFGAILIISLLWYWRILAIRRKYRLQEQIANAELEKLEIQKSYLVAKQKAGVLQMNPHFIFNSLNTIKGFYAQNEYKSASRFISKFSRLLRLILETQSTFIPLKDEIEMLEIYLELMMVRYSGVFNYSITFPEGLVNEIMLPPMMLQPVVENAIIHGLAPLSKKGKLSIDIGIDEDSIICTIEDDGVGFVKSGFNTTSHHSIGIENIKERLEILSKQYNHKCSFTVDSPIDGKESLGCRVRIKLPKIQYESNNH